MDIHIDVDLKSYTNKIFIPRMYHGDQGKVIGDTTEWPCRYPFLKSYSTEAFERAKEGWTETGKVYHLLSRDEKRNPVTHEYKEYFDGENKFIAVKEYDSVKLRRVEKINWYYDADNNLIFRLSNNPDIWADLTDLSQDNGKTRFSELVLKDFIQKFFIQEIEPDQRYEKTPPVLNAELAARNYDLKEKNASLEKEKCNLEAEKERLQLEKEQIQREKEELEKSLWEMTDENRRLKQKMKIYSHFNKEQLPKANIFNLKKIKDKAKSLND